jgi:hypothetical protein
MFRALLAHPQEAFHQRHLVYCVRVMSVGCSTITVSFNFIRLISVLGGCCYLRALADLTQGRTTMPIESQ